MANPKSAITFGIQVAINGRYYSRFPSGSSGEALAESLPVALSAAPLGAASVFTPPSNQYVPTHYVDAGASGSGSGTSSNPFSLIQACTVAQPGWRVLVRAGTYVGPARGSNSSGSFAIAAQGTQSNPIIFFAENYAALNVSGRSILQHVGTGTGISGGPVLSLMNGHHWVGFYINEDQARSLPDTGPVFVRGSYNRLSYMRISRGSWQWTPAQNNQAAIRLEGDPTTVCRNNVISDCLIENYSGQPGGSQQGIQVFSPNNNPALTTGLLTVEYNLFDNCQAALTLKGAGFTRPLHGGIIFRNNLCRASSFGQCGGVDIMDCSGELGRNQIYQNIFVNGAFGVRTMIQGDYPCRDIDIINNTAINLINGDDYIGLHSDRGQAALGSGWRIHNNLNAGTAVPLFKSPYEERPVIAIASRSHNISQPSQWGYFASVGTGTQSLAQWVANTVFDDSSINANPQLVSNTWGSADLGKLALGSPARNAGIDLLNLNGAGTSAPCHMGAYSSDGVVIGIRPLT